MNTSRILSFCPIHGNKINLSQTFKFCFVQYQFTEYRIQNTSQNLVSEMFFGILGSVFIFLEVFLESGGVFGFWEVFCHHKTVMFVSC